MTKGRDYLQSAYDLGTRLEQLRQQHAALSEMIMHITTVFGNDCVNRNHAVADKNAELIARRLDLE